MGDLPEDAQMTAQNKLLTEQNAMLSELRDVMREQNGILDGLRETMDKQNRMIDYLMVANSSPAVARAVQRREAAARGQPDKE